MSHYATAELAEIRREQLIADATVYRQIRKHRSLPSAHPRRPRSAFHAWLAAGQL